MLIVAVVMLIVLGISVRAVRTSGEGPRWPFLVACTVSGAAMLALAIATVIALTGGRDRWNSWVSGSRSSETVTLWLVLIVGPGLAAACGAMLMIGVPTCRPRSATALPGLAH